MATGAQISKFPFKDREVFLVERTTALYRCERCSLAMDHRTKYWHIQLSQVVLDLENFTFSRAGITKSIGDIRQYTDNYLSHAENLSSCRRDDHLKGLIADHSDKIRAVLACTHALSLSALREQLQAIGVNAQKEEEILTFMKTIITVHELNKTAISTAEIKWVYCLKELMSADPDGAQVVFHSYDQLMVEESIPTLLTPNMLQGILQIAIKRLGLRLDQWKEAGEWTKAHRNSRWMCRVSSSLSHLKSILDDNIQYWESWASWEPTLQHLQALDELHASQRRELQHIFALDGPDFKSSPPKGNLLTALVSNSRQDSLSELRHGILHLQLGNGGLSLAGLVDSLLKKIVKGFKISEQVGAIISYIVRNNVIDEVTLGSLDVIETSDPSLISTIFQAISSDTRERRLSAVMKIIPALANSQTESLRRSLSPLIRLTVRESVSALQDKFNEYLRQGKSLENVGKKLHGIGFLIRQNLWLQPLIDPQVWAVVLSYPSRDNMECLFELREQAANDKTAAGVTFSSLADLYCISVFTDRDDLDIQDRVLIQHLLEFWQKELSLDRRRLAINVAQRSSIPSDLRCELFKDIHQMSEDFCEIIFNAIFYIKERGCVDFARAIASDRKIGQQEKYRWRSVLKSMIDMQSSTLLNYAATNLDIHQWFQWLRDIRSLFPLSNSEFSRIFNPALYDWATRLEHTQMEALMSLEKIIGTHRLRRILFVPENEELVIIFLEMVQETNQKCLLKPIYDQILTRLAPDWSNLPQLGKVISQLRQVSDCGRTYCLRLVEDWKTLPLKTCQGLLQVWLSQRPHSVRSPSEVTQDDLEALQQVGMLLGIDITGSEGNLSDGLAAACDHLNQQYEELIAEASRLNAIRRTLKAHNRDETKEFLASIGIADPDDSIVDIPTALEDVIESHSFHEFEITFPLSHLKPLQRMAMGVGNAQTIMVRLNLEDDFELRPQFCVHMGPEKKAGVRSRSANKNTAQVGEHSYWIADRGSPAPDLNFCTGQGNRTTYLLSMLLWRHFTSQGFDSLESIHKIVSSAIGKYGQNCLVCGSKHNTKVFRATICQQGSCNAQFCRADYEARLGDLRWDPLVIDLLLLGVFATVQKGRLDFLDPCPIGNKSTIVQTMAGLPPLQSLQGASDLYKSVKSLAPDVEALILWMASYRGFLTSATGLLKIPNLPGVHQFVLASAPPEVETGYASHIPLLQNTSQVVFHGTTMDRLFPILQRGIQVGSGTSLMQHGASMGNGIYCAADIAMPFGFAPVSYGWPNSSLSNTKVIFGCELVGSHIPVGGVYVVPNATQLRVRYIFLFPSTVTVAPVTQQIVPAMLSAFSLLRSGQI